ncbi:L,D-transpeptidase family protein [Hyphobacterium marinum]|uniref:L,D-transpeptidase family protein n=1 Tax=Hyphobacterium marinum TaxID=3116574 RepID=A0ABU7LWA2_9PROT|nr:L,D-transpeptidase family protein [Hyphobacterium sp. Y6023]MEE2565805.1 L,D-transpeptidase family protein [Hyphobacterium sp. Y6023]
MALIFLCLTGGTTSGLAQTGTAEAPAWTGPQAGDALYQLTSAVADAGAHGLNPFDYALLDLIALDPRYSDPDADRLATDTYLSLARDLLQGRVAVDDPVRWPFAPRQRDLDAWLIEALETGTVADSLDALAPQMPDYRVLQTALLNLVHDGAGGTPVLIGPGEALEAGMSGERVDALRGRLETLGYLAPREFGEPADATHSAVVFDDAMTEAVQAVQRDAHLEADGIAGEDTIEWLDTPDAVRVAQLRVNLERLRWLPDDLGARHIRVNLPDFRLQVFEGGVAVRSHDVIVGRRSRASPVLTATLTHIIANPWWETPHSLAVRDELPLFRRDPGAVQRLGFQVIDRATGDVVDASGIDWAAVSASDFPYRLRQAPGPLNALGQVKLIFPNPHNTYLHDTPSRALFERPERAFSSGCVRVRDPVALAQWASEVGGGLDAAGVRAAIDSGRETRIDIATPVRVHFLYLTAFAGEGGRAVFVPDLYGRDAAVLAALDAANDRVIPAIVEPETSIGCPALP